MSTGDEPTDQFAMPAVDGSALTETGVILAGLDAERLLAGLGLASLADDPTLVTLLVDQVRHSGGGAELTMDELLELGARRWRDVRPALASAGGGATLSGSVRQSWERAMRIVGTAEIGTIGTATSAYLAACWLRNDAVDELASPRAAARPVARHHEEDSRAVSEVAG
jgi:hypothetical protein